MSRPLYETASPEPNGCSADGHAGLWFDKFCNTWKNDDDSWAMPAEEKLRWIKTVAKAQHVGDRKQIDEHVRRQARMVERLSGVFAVFMTESRFVTGLGRSHPVENGFAWHPVLGTPYLPGSSIKGLLKAWTEQGAEPRPDSEMRSRIFGCRDQARAGGVCFLDAVPICPVRLDADVMTPHYAGWTPEDPPGDWRSPIPIPFLATAEATPFLFAFVPRGAQGDDAGAVFGWLREALEWAGGGAKTAVGYGRFRHCEGRTRDLAQALENEERARREEQERERLQETPEGRWRLKVEGRSEFEILDMVRIRLEKERLADPEERQAFAHAVSTLYPDWIERWRRGDRNDRETKVGSKKLKERAHLLDRELAGTGSH